MKDHRTPAVVRVFVLDSHDVIHRGFRGLLGISPDLLLAGGATTRAEALALVPVLEPDVVVIDVNLPDGNGIQVCRELRSAMPELRCLMITAGDEDDACFAALLAGAAGFVTKRAPSEEIVDTLRRVARGEVCIDRSASAQLLVHRPAVGDGEPGAPRHLIAATEMAELTSRQRETLELVLEGGTDREIAARLAVPEATVASEIAALFGVLGLRRRLREAFDDASRIPRDS